MKKEKKSHIELFIKAMVLVKMPTMTLTSMGTCVSL